MRKLAVSPPARLCPLSTSHGKVGLPVTSPPQGTSRFQLRPHLFSLGRISLVNSLCNLLHSVEALHCAGQAKEDAPGGMGFELRIWFPVEFTSFWSTANTSREGPGLI